MLSIVVLNSNGAGVKRKTGGKKGCKRGYKTNIVFVIPIKLYCIALISICICLRSCTFCARFNNYIHIHLKKKARERKKN